jgi:hypothetical protein
MAYIPSRGEIVFLDFDPASGREMKGPHLWNSGNAYGHWHRYARCCALSPIEVIGLAHSKYAF